MSSQIGGTHNLIILGFPLWNPKKNVLLMWSHRELQNILKKGEWWFFSNLGCGVYCEIEITCHSSFWLKITLTIFIFLFLQFNMIMNFIYKLVLIPSLNYTTHFFHLRNQGMCFAFAFNCQLRVNKVLYRKYHLTNLEVHHCV
jgi:hypothetical protein